MKGDYYMATYLEEMIKINKRFIRLFPNKMIYQQYDEGLFDFKVIVNDYLVTLLRSNGMEPTYDSLMEYARNSGDWEEKGYGHSEYMGENSTVAVEIESWRTPIKKGVQKPKYAVRSTGGKHWFKIDYRVYRQASKKSNKMHLVFETHYEHKLIAYLLKTGFNTTMADLNEESLEEEVSDDVLEKQFLDNCKLFKMKNETGENFYEYGFIRNCIYCETYDDDMGCVVFMVYDEKKDEWEQVYKTYDLNDMKSKLGRISSADIWDKPLNEYTKSERWWN